MKLPIDTDIFPEKSGAYVVGGSIRDLLVGKKPFDYDLAVAHDPEIFAGRLAARASGHVIELGKHGYKMLRVATKDHFFDIVSVSGNDIHSDLSGRDFSINAMAMEISSGNLIDPLDGQKDLAARKVRMVSREVFRRDPLRLLRAYRMAAALDFTIDGDTRAAIAADADLIRESAGERIRDELFKIMQSARSHAYLFMMAQSRLLFGVFPEFLKLNRLRLLPDDPRTVFDLTLDTYNHLEKMLNPDDELMRSLGGHFFHDDRAVRSILLKWSVLFHNLGWQPPDPPVGSGKINDADTRAARSVAMARAICRRLRFSRRQSDTIATAIGHHLKPQALFEARHKNAHVEKEFIRLFLNCTNSTPDVLLLALAEFRGRKADDDRLRNEFSAFIQMLIEKYDAKLLPRAALPPPINGHDLITEFGMQPSAEFKHILKRVEEARLSQPTYSREEALQLVKQLLSLKK